MRDRPSEEIRGAIDVFGSVDMMFSQSREAQEPKSHRSSQLEDPTTPGAPPPAILIGT
jgi:hypothetical protein